MLYKVLLIGHDFVETKCFVITTSDKNRGALKFTFIPTWINWVWKSLKANRIIPGILNVATDSHLYILIHRLTLWIGRGKINWLYLTWMVTGEICTPVSILSCCTSCVGENSIISVGLKIECVLGSWRCYYICV